MIGRKQTSNSQPATPQPLRRSRTMLTMAAPHRNATGRTIRHTKSASRKVEAARGVIRAPLTLGTNRASGHSERQSCPPVWVGVAGTPAAGGGTLASAAAPGGCSSVEPQEDQMTLPANSTQADLVRLSLLLCPGPVKNAPRPA